MAVGGPTAVRRTSALTVCVAVVAAGLAAVGPRDTLLVTRWDISSPVAVIGLAVLFCAAELCLLHVELRRHSYSVTLAGIPLLVGMLVCGPPELVVARVAGSAVAVAIQRLPRLKACYNLAAFAIEAAAAAALAHLLVVRGPDLTIRTAAICYLVVVVVDQLSTFVMSRVIGWHQGRRLERHQLAQMHGPAVLSSIASTTAGLAVLLMVDHGTVGVGVLMLVVVASGMAYRSFQGLHRRHHSLEQLHDFVGLDSASDSIEDLAGRMLGQVRSLMQAGRAELLLVDQDSVLHVSVGEDEVPRVQDPSWAMDDTLVRRVRDLEEPVLMRAGCDAPGDRAWLHARGVGDAVVVPLPRSSGSGALMVLDRLGDTGSFTREDQSLLQTVAGHLAVTVRNSTLLRRLRHEASHDVLTGLANRTLLEQMLAADLADTTRTDSAVLLLDLDRFKEVNDTLGHNVGDALLRSVAAVVVATLPPTATLARLGGDEFAALVPGCGGAVAALALATEVRHALSVPIVLPEATLTTTASIGVAVAPRGCDDIAVLRHADTAMYAAKDNGDAVVLYTEELDRGRAERLSLLADLHLALDRGELEVLYQPKLDLVTDRVDSVEALVRWEHPRLGTLSPVVFVPLAEANGLIAALTRQVLREALHQCAAWRHDGIDVAVAVNISARTVNDPTLPESVVAALLEAGVPASRLILEITESSVMDDPDRSVEILERIAAFGITLSLDDFGTGYSSLAHLHRLPVGEIKIDQSFVAGLTAERDRAQLLVRTIVTLAASLGYRVVAEGVATEETVQVLRGLGCDLVQGYWISPPERPQRIAAFVRGRVPHPVRALRAAT